MKTPPQGISIRNNVFRDYAGISCDVYVNMFRAFTSDDEDSSVTIEGNRGYDGRAPYHIISAKRVSLRNNEWRNYKRPSLIAYETGGGKVRDILIQGDHYHRVGTIGERSIAVSSVDNLRIESSLFTEFGIDATRTVGIYFDVGAGGANAVSNGVELIRNRFTHSRPNATVVGVGAHTMDAAGNRQEANVYGALLNRFVAVRSDVAAAIIPVVEGASMAGAVTSGFDHGCIYWVEGNTCHVDYFVAWTAHSGTGRLRVGVPAAPAEMYAPNGRRAPFAVEVSGAGGAVVSPNQMIASFNTQDMSKGTGPGLNTDGSIHLHVIDQTTGALRDFAVPNAPTQLRIRGSYRIRDV